MSKSLDHIDPPKPSVCLVAIVKDELGSDESHCISRLLDSVSSLITETCIIYTQSWGKKHGLAEKVAQGWHDRHPDIQSFVQYYDWDDDFAEARNVAMHWAQHNSKADWLLLLDADEVLIDMAKYLPRALAKVPPDVNALVVPILHDGRVVTRVNIIRNIPGWSYKFAHHETLAFNGDPVLYKMICNPTNFQHGPHVTTPQDGARSKDPEKMTKDINRLQDLWTETKEPRYLFFLGMCYLAIKEKANALLAFEIYVNEEKVFDTARGSLYTAMVAMGRLNGELGHASWHWFSRAYVLCPDRPEALGEMATGYAKQNDWANAYIYALAASMCRPKINLEFLESFWLEWRATDILAASLMNLGRYDEAVPLLDALVHDEYVPRHERPRILTHLTEARKRSQ